MFKKHPKGIMILFLIEMWERFGFYIMSAVYVLYMDKIMLFDGAKKGILYGLFLAMAYLFPLVGGWLGDKIIGQIKTVRLGIIIMILGYIALAVSGYQNEFPFYSGLEKFDTNRFMGRCVVIPGLGTEKTKKRNQSRLFVFLVRGCNGLFHVLEIAAVPAV